MQDYHLAWLSKYADRDADWLRAQLAAGFHVHHVDGNHQNNDPGNLVLVWGPDHLANLHGMKKPPRRGKTGPRGPNLRGQLKQRIKAFDDYLKALGCEARSAPGLPQVGP